MRRVGLLEFGASDGVGDKGKGVSANMAKMGRFKRYFLRGLAVLLPTVLTIWIFIWGYNFISDTISVYIKRGIVYVIKLAGGSDEELAKLWVNTILSVAGFVIAVGIVCVVGMVLASVLGRSIWRGIERLMMNTPLLKQVYPYVKQVTDFFFTQEEAKKMFSKVVAFEYPRKGIWSIGYVTGSGLRKIVEGVEKEFVTILIPTAPTPLSGFVIMVPKEDTIELDMTIEEALRFIISVGVIVPGGQEGTKSLEGKTRNLPASDRRRET
jgi:uncharacterized membrane protein